MAEKVTLDPALLALEQAQTGGFDLSTEGDFATWRCECGFECDTAYEMIRHLHAHGSRRVTVTGVAP